MSTPLVRVLPDQLQKIVSSIFIKTGVSEKESDYVAQHLVTSNLMGHDSHGVMRVPEYIKRIKKGEIVPNASLEVENETASSAIVNGNWGFGQTVAKFAMDLAIQKAKSQVISCVTVRQCNHVGRVGAYTSLASSQGMVGIGMANMHGSIPRVAPFGGCEARLTTNPISIAFPSGGVPDFLLDMTTSVVAEGKVRMKFNRGENVPEGWIIDSGGFPTQDPSKFYNTPRGALLPLGGVVGYKGFGLSLAVDVLSGALSKAECSNAPKANYGNACFFIAINIEAFTSLNRFTTQVNSLIDYMKSSPFMPETESILMPGEPEIIAFEKKRREGIFIEEKTWKLLLEF